VSSVPNGLVGAMAAAEADRRTPTAHEFLHKRAGEGHCEANDRTARVKQLSQRKANFRKATAAVHCRCCRNLSDQFVVPQPPLLEDATSCLVNRVHKLAIKKKANRWPDVRHEVEGLFGNHVAAGAGHQVFLACER